MVELTGTPCLLELGSGGRPCGVRRSVSEASREPLPGADAPRLQREPRWWLWGGFKDGATADGGTDDHGLSSALSASPMLLPNPARSVVRGASRPRPCRLSVEGYPLRLIDWPPASSANDNAMELLALGGRAGLARIRSSGIPALSGVKSSGVVQRSGHPRLQSPSDQMPPKRAPLIPESKLTARRRHGSGRWWEALGTSLGIRCIRARTELISMATIG